MTAPVGHRGFISKDSKASEERSARIISEVLSTPKYKDFTSDPSYETNSIYNTTLSVTAKTKDSTVCNPDFGLIKYKGKPVAVGDNKWQDSHQNVVERCNLYIADAIAMNIDLKNVFLVFFPLASPELCHACSEYSDQLADFCIGTSRGLFHWSCDRRGTSDSEGQQ